MCTGRHRAACHPAVWQHLRNNLTMKYLRSLQIEWSFTLYSPSYKSPFFAMYLRKTKSDQDCDQLRKLKHWYGWTSYDKHRLVIRNWWCTFLFHVFCHGPILPRTARKFLECWMLNTSVGTLTESPEIGYSTTRKPCLSAIEWIVDSNHSGDFTFHQILCAHWYINHLLNQTEIL